MAKEKCVNCGKDTPYDKTTNINLRQFYVEAVGQLCRDCFIDIYQPEYDEDDE